MGGGGKGFFAEHKKYSRMHIPWLGGHKRLSLNLEHIIGDSSSTGSILESSNLLDGTNFVKLFINLWNKKTLFFKEKLQQLFKILENKFPKYFHKENI